MVKVKQMNAQKGVRDQSFDLGTQAGRAGLAAVVEAKKRDGAAIYVTCNRTEYKVLAYTPVRGFRVDVGKDSKGKN